MNHRIFLVRLLLIISLPLQPAPAQTATWIAPGSVSSLSTMYGDWNTAANWDTGVVPNGSGALAIVNQSMPIYTLMTSIPGGALPVVTGDVTIGELRFALPDHPTTHSAGLAVGSPYFVLNRYAATGHLRLDGAGIMIGSTGSNYTYVSLNIYGGSVLDFANQATITRSGPNTVYLNLNGMVAQPVTVRFFDDSSPGSGWNTTVSANGPIVWEFHDRASAGANTLPLPTDSTMTFLDQAGAGSSRIQFLYNGPVNDATVRFAGSSTAGQSSISSPTTLIGAVEFIEQATGGAASINGVRRLDITGATTGAGMTGRVRATTSVLAPASVVADDARSISLNSVYVQDLLLGSNALQVSSGYIGNIRDSGGAYLSAAGENLVGGGIIKVGTGTLTLGLPTYNPLDPAHPSYNVMSGPTIVRQGNLALFNRIASTTIESGGKLSGGGIIGGNLLNQGLLAPSYYAAPMQVTGNFVQSAGGILIFDSNSLLYSSGQQPIQVGGTATLAGRLASYAFAALFPNQAPGTFSRVVLTAGAISGRFDTAGSDSPAVRFPVTAEYGPTSVTLRFEMLPISALAATPGQRALGAYLDGAYRFSSLEVGGLNNLTSVDAFRRVLDNFAPDRYGVLVENSLASVPARCATLDHLLTAARESGSRRPAAFVEGGQRRLTFDAVDGLPPAAGTTDGGLAGVTWGQGHWNLGGYVAQEKSHLRLDAAGSKADITSVEPGVFVQYASGGFFINAAAGFSRDRYDLHRTVDYVYYYHTVATDTAAPSGTRTDYSCTAGWNWRRSGWTFTPFAGAMLTKWRIDDFTETNNSSLQNDPMAFTGWSAESQRIRAGFELRGAAFHGRLSPRLAVAWWHEFATDRAIPARFVGASAGYLAPGRPAETDLVQAGLGLDWRISRQLGFSVNAGLVQGRNSRTTSDFSAGFRWEF